MKIFDEEIEEMKKDTLEDPVLKTLRPFVDLPFIDQLLIVTMYGILLFLSLAYAEPPPDPEIKRAILKSMLSGFHF